MVQFNSVEGENSDFCSQDGILPGGNSTFQGYLILFSILGGLAILIGFLSYDSIQ
jgi:hypothetical protein